MGQKINATIFRSGLKNSDWCFKYTNQNLEESSIFLYKNIEIQNHINKIFKKYNIIVTNCQIEHTTSTVKILIFFYKIDSTTKNTEAYNNTNRQIISTIITNIITLSTHLYFKNKITTIKTQDLSKKFESLINKNSIYYNSYKKFLKDSRNFLKNPLQKNIIKILLIAITEKNSSKLLADVISLYLTKNKKRHNFLFFLLKKIITNLISTNFSNVKGIKIQVKGRLNGAPRAKSKNITIGKVPLQSLNNQISYHNSTAFTQNGTFGIKVWICEK